VCAARLEFLKFACGVRSNHTEGRALCVFAQRATCASIKAFSPNSRRRFRHKNEFSRRLNYKIAAAKLYPPRRLMPERTQFAFTPIFLRRRSSYTHITSFDLQFCMCVKHFITYTHTVEKERDGFCWLPAHTIKFPRVDNQRRPFYTTAIPEYWAINFLIKCKPP